MNRTAAETLITEVINAYWNGTDTDAQDEPLPIAQLFDIPAITDRAFDVTPTDEHSLCSWVGQLQIVMLAKQHRRELRPTGPTDLPCPPWCDRPTGHTFEEFKNGLRRSHVRRFTDHASCVSVELRERATAPTDGLSDLHTDPAALNVVVHLSDGVGYLTAGGARRLAQQLIDAAELHDQEHALIVGESLAGGLNS